MEIIDFKIDYNFFERSLFALKYYNNKMVTVEKALCIDNISSGTTPWGTLYNCIVDMWRYIFNDKEKYFIFSTFLFECKDDSNFENQSVLNYSIHTREPKIGKVISLVESKFDPGFYFADCCLEKPDNVDWTHYLWEVLMKDYGRED